MHIIELDGKEMQVGGESVRECVNVEYASIFTSNFKFHDVPSEVAVTVFCCLRKSSEGLVELCDGVR